MSSGEEHKRALDNSHFTQQLSLQESSASGDPDCPLLICLTASCLLPSAACVIATAADCDKFARSKIALE